MLSVQRAFSMYRELGEGVSTPVQATLSGCARWKENCVSKQGTFTVCMKGPLCTSQGSNLNHVAKPSTGIPADSSYPNWQLSLSNTCTSLSQVVGSFWDCSTWQTLSISFHYSLSLSILPLFHSLTLRVEGRRWKKGSSWHPHTLGTACRSSSVMVLQSRMRIK